MEIVPKESQVLPSVHMCVELTIKSDGRTRSLHSAKIEDWDIFHLCKVFYFLPLHSTWEKAEFLTLMEDISDLHHGLM